MDSSQSGHNMARPQAYYIAANAPYDPQANSCDRPPVGTPIIHVQQIVTSTISVTRTPAATVKFGRLPISVVCSRCGHRGLTYVQHVVKADTGIVMCILCLVFWPAAFLPLCVDQCKTTKHLCLDCGATLATVRPGYCW